MPLFCKKSINVTCMGKSQEMLILNAEWFLCNCYYWCFLVFYVWLHSHFVIR